MHNARVINARDLGHVQGTPQSRLQDVCVMFLFANLSSVWRQLGGITIFGQEAKMIHSTSKMAVGFSQSKLFFQLQMAVRHGGRHCQDTTLQNPVQSGVAYRNSPIHFQGTLLNAALV